VCPYLTVPWVVTVLFLMLVCCAGSVTPLPQPGNDKPRSFRLEALRYDELAMIENKNQGGPKILLSPQGHCDTCKCSDACQAHACSFQHCQCHHGRSTYSQGCLETHMWCQRLTFLTLCCHQQIRIRQQKSMGCSSCKAALQQLGCMKASLAHSKLPPQYMHAVLIIVMAVAVRSSTDMASTAKVWTLCVQTCNPIDEGFCSGLSISLEGFPALLEST